MAYAARLNSRMQKELKLLLTDPPPGVSLLSPSCENSSSSSSLSIFEAEIKGPEETVYSGGSFAIRIQVPERYPFHPPNVTFVTPIYHPNIDNGGRICLDILNLPPKGAWRPSLNISTVLTSIGLLMSEPNPDDGLMYEASREYKYNRQLFDEKARLWTEKYAKDGNCVKSCCDTAIDTPSKVDEIKQAKEIPVERESNDEGSRKRICIGRQKLSLRDVFEKTANDDKENERPVNQEFSKSQDTDDYSTKTELSKPIVASTKGCPGPEHAMDDSEHNKDKLKQGQKIDETYIVLDSEDSEEEDDNRLRRSRPSHFRKRGEWRK